MSHNRTLRITLTAKSLQLIENWKEEIRKEIATGKHTPRIPNFEDTEALVNDLVLFVVEHDCMDHVAAQIAETVSEAVAAGPPGCGDPACAVHGVDRRGMN